MITRQMLLAIVYLHKCEIAHRDLKLENFLFQKKETDYVKLIDFGLSKFVNKDINMTQAYGTLGYMAPEVLSRSYTKLADMWSLGVIVYMMLTGSPLFKGSDHQRRRK